MTSIQPALHKLLRKKRGPPLHGDPRSEIVVKRKRDYTLCHQLQRLRGKASRFPCTHADGTCRGRIVWACISGEYIDIRDFFPLCDSHRRRRDETPEYRAALSAAWTPERRARQAGLMAGRTDRVTGGRKGACGLHQIAQGKPCTCGMHIQTVSDEEAS